MVAANQIFVCCFSSGDKDQPWQRELILVFSPLHNMTGRAYGMASRSIMLAGLNWRNRYYQTKEYVQLYFTLLNAHLHLQDPSNFPTKASRRVTIVRVERCFHPVTYNEYKSS